MAHQTKSPESLDVSRFSGGFMFLVSVCFEVKKFIKVQKRAIKSRIKSRINYTLPKQKKPHASAHPGWWEAYLHGAGLHLPLGHLHSRGAGSLIDCILSKFNGFVNRFLTEGAHTKPPPRTRKHGESYKRQPPARHPEYGMALCAFYCMLKNRCMMKSYGSICTLFSVSSDFSS